MRSITQGFSAIQIAAIRVYDDAGNVVETHEYKDDFKELLLASRR
jgi:hypothetical protein